MPTTTKTKRPVLKKTVRSAPRRTSSISTPAPAPSSWYYEAPKSEMQLSENIEMETIEPIAPAHFTPPSSIVSRPRPWTSRLMAVLVFLFPFVSFPLTFSPHEFPKQLFLSLAVVLGAGIILIESRKKTVFDFIPRHVSILFGLGALVIACIGAARGGLVYQSFLGHGGTESLSILGLLLLGMWILICYHMRSYTRMFIQALIASGSIISAVTLLALLNVSLYKFAGAGFNPAGTTTIAGIIAASTIILTAGRLLTRPSIREKILLSLALIYPVVLLLGIGFRVPFVITAIGLGIAALATVTRGNRSPTKKTVAISIGALLALILAIFPFTNFLTTPLEISPSHKETWSIVRQVLQQSPLVGSGPASFSADYLRFRSLPILQTPFWNIAFDWGSSALLTLAATVGILGTVFLFLALISILVTHALKLIKTSSLEDDVTLAAAGIALFVAAFLAPTTFSLLFFFATLLGLILGASAMPFSLQPHPVAARILRSSAMILLIVFLLLQGIRTSAEIIAARGVAVSGTDISASIKMLTLGNKLNPYVDTYHRLASDINRALLRNTLNDPALAQDQEKGLALVREGVDRTLKEARRATELTPNHVANWITLGNVYLEIAPFTSGAADAAVEAFGRAQSLSPSDPSILVNLAIAKTLAARTGEKENAADLTASAEQFLKKAAEIRPSFPFAHLELARFYAQNNKPAEALAAYRTAQQLAQNDPTLHYEIGLFLIQTKQYEEAIKELTEAVRLAPNFSNARWYLAEAYEEKGQITDALAQIEKVVELNPQNEAAKTRLEELKKKAEEKK